MKLKVCGMRESGNIQELLTIQPDYIGFIFHEDSPRNVIDIPKVTIPEVTANVGVFVNKTKEFIADKAKSHQLDYIQLHGRESSTFCHELQSIGFKIIKAFNIHEDFDFEQIKQYESSCHYYLFDAFGKKAGGNGIVFNWELLQKYQGKTPFLLSGGITENHLDSITAIKHDKLHGIDINSGFEIKPALKDVQKIKRFKEKLTSLNQEN